jgi:Na+-translocating ferredoxin:NAD+ oxidoreductase RnfA subunit
MTHTQSIIAGMSGGAGFALALVLVAVCVWLLIRHFGKPNDHDDGDAPGLLVETIQKLPFGFHSPDGARA